MFGENEYMCARSIVFDGNKLKYCVRRTRRWFGVKFVKFLISTSVLSASQLEAYVERDCIVSQMPLNNAIGMQLSQIREDTCDTGERV